MTDPAGNVFACVPGAIDSAETWVLLHGSDGRETDLLPIADRLVPGAATIAPRGTVKTPGGYAHFRRHPDRSLDEEDLLARAKPLAALIDGASTTMHLPRRLVVLGFSNGAIMAAALIESYPDLFDAAVLLRPLTPFPDQPVGARTPLPVLILDGAHDDRRLPGDGQLLADRLVSAGALVTHAVLPTGHGISTEDEHAISAWLDDAPLRARRSTL
jgi:predicted esterase